MQPAKKSEQQGKTEYVYFPEGDGVTDAYTAIRRMLDERWRLRGDEHGQAPLFIQSDGQGWTVREAAALFKLSGRAIGIDESDLGAHCGRIGGATDLFASDCPAALLQVSGRWARAR